MEDESLTPIQQYYKGKSIFLTGGTGLIGKVLVEKFLRCCYSIAHIYLLVREKRGKTIEKRLDELFTCELFDLLKKERPEFRKKVSVIYGDLESPGLSINEVDLEKLKANVDIVIHSAARVRWNFELRVQANAHIIATNSLLDMVKKFEKAKVFLYVSSAAVHRDLECNVPEKIVKKHMSPKQLLDALQWMNDETINKISSAFLNNNEQPYMNSYFFTKALTENIIEENHGHLLTAIVRPTMVIPIFKDPYPGWSDALQSLQGLVVAIAKGFMRIVRIELNMKFCVVPADLVVNTIIATPWYKETMSSDNKNDVLVLNTTLRDDQYFIFSKELLDTILNLIFKYPLVNIFRYPSLTIYYSSFWFNVHSFFDHYLPAFIIDFLLKIFTGKPIMLSLYKRLKIMDNTLRAMAEKPWVFKMENFHKVSDQMSAEDAKIFYMRIKDIDWDKFFEQSIKVGRKIVAKEDMSNIEYARKKSKIWYWTITALQWILIYYVSKYFFLKFIY